MRYKFAREEFDTILGRRFKKDSIKFENQPVVVTKTNSFTVADIIGMAYDIQREEDGWLTAEVEWTTREYDPASIVGTEAFLTIYGDKVSDQDENGVKVIDDIQLRALFLTDKNYWV